MLSEQLVRSAAEAAGLRAAAIVIQPLDAGDPGVRIDPDSALYPASMIKVPLAMVAYQDIEDGRLEPDRRFEVTPANMTFNDRPSPLVPGYRSTVRELIELMITISDNVATNMFFDILGRERATHIAQNTFGLRGTAFHRKLSGSEPLIVDPGWTSGVRNTHPPGDAARAFELLARDRVPHADALRATLGRQQFNDMLDLGLAPGDRFYHKTGGTDEVAHDGGILATAEGRSYVLVVYTGLPSSDASSAKFGPFAHRIREML
ncbi:MAG TPA: serine hydrolase [Candidatus Baltobacteraceae bacterium]|jgi:beta-lactamase class A